MHKTLEQIYRDHRQGLFSIALSITGSVPIAEDSVHNAFAKLFRRSLPAGDPVAYVFKTVRNSALDSIRCSRRRDRLHESLFNEVDRNHCSGTPHDTLVSQEQATLLQNAIDELEPLERESVLLKSLAGLTFEQAGKVTDTSPKTIATRYRRALQKLEQKLKGRL